MTALFCVCQNRIHEDKIRAEQEPSPRTANTMFLKSGKVNFVLTSLKAKCYSLYQRPKRICRLVLQGHLIKIAKGKLILVFSTAGMSCLSNKGISFLSELHEQCLLKAVMFQQPITLREQKLCNEA